MNGKSGASVKSWLFAEALTQQNTSRERIRALPGKKSMRYTVGRYAVVRKGKRDT